MNPHDINQPKQYLTERELEKRTGRSVKCWQRDRMTGNGPPFIRCGGKVLYDCSDFKTWMNARKVQSTSDQASEI